MEPNYQQVRPDDPANPRSKELPPALVEAIHDSPTAMPPLARFYTATVLHEMFKESVTYTPAQKRDFVDLCSKLGDLDAKKRADDAAAGGGVSITINIPAIGNDPSSTVVIDQKAVVVPDTPAITIAPEFEVVDE